MKVCVLINFDTTAPSATQYSSQTIRCNKFYSWSARAVPLQHMTMTDGRLLSANHPNVSVPLPALVRVNHDVINYVVGLTDRPKSIVGLQVHDLSPSRLDLSV